MLKRNRTKPLAAILNPWIGAGAVGRNTNILSALRDASDLRRLGEAVSRDGKLTPGKVHYFNADDYTELRLAFFNSVLLLIIGKNARVPSSFFNLFLRFTPFIELLCLRVHVRGNLNFKFKLKLNYFGTLFSYLILLRLKYLRF